MVPGAYDRIFILRTAHKVPIEEYNKCTLAIRNSNYWSRVFLCSEIFSTGFHPIMLYHFHGLPLLLCICTFLATRQAPVVATWLASPTSAPSPIANDDAHTNPTKLNSAVRRDPIISIKRDLRPTEWERTNGGLLCDNPDQATVVESASMDVDSGRRARSRSPKPFRRCAGPRSGVNRAAQHGFLTLRVVPSSCRCMNHLGTVKVLSEQEIAEQDDGGEGEGDVEREFFSSSAASAMEDSGTLVSASSGRGSEDDEQLADLFRSLGVPRRG